MDTCRASTGRPAGSTPSRSTSPTFATSVVLVNFWTFTCINWLRQEPYVRAWSQAYRDDGLVVIGVHTPEFSFEHELDRVRRAVEVRENRLPGRARQRLRGLAGLLEPVLAGAVLRRPRRGDPGRALRRGALRGIRACAPRAARNRARPLDRPRRRRRGGGRLGRASLSGDVRRRGARRTTLIGRRVAAQSLWRSPASGPSNASGSSSTSRAAASPTASTPATRTSSSPPAPAPRFRSAYSSTVRPPGAASRSSTSTRTATASSPTGASTSSSASPAPLTNGRSSSRSRAAGAEAYVFTFG